MRALVLAAGRGARLGPAGGGLPKPLVPLGGRPIIESSLDLLRRAGIVDVVVNAHHQADLMMARLGDGAAFGVRIRWSHEPVLRGTGGAVDQARALLADDSFVVVYGDNRFDGDLRPLLASHAESGAVATVASLWRDDVRQSGELELDEAGRVLALHEKRPGERRAGWVNAGIVIAAPALLDFVPSDLHSDLAADVIPAALRAGALVRAAPFPGTVLWVDTPGDLERARARLGDETGGPGQTS